MQIHFLFRQRLDGYVFNPHRPEGLNFVDDATGVAVQIKATGKEGDWGFGYDNLELRAAVARDATERQVRFVETLLNERTIRPDETPVKLPYSISQREVIASDGKVAKGYSPTANFLPTDLQELCIETGVELEEKASRLVRLLRWVEKASGPVDFQESKDQRFCLYWRTTQEKYKGVPWPEQGAISAKHDGFGGLVRSDQYQQNLAEVWGAGIDQEPLGHQLLREANEIAYHNNRSALLICYSALEVGLKQHISKCAPDAGWLAMYSPAPPLLKILKEYLPQLHQDNQQFNNWVAIKSELRLVEKFVEDRNRLTHRGETIAGSIDEYLRITTDLLYAFDVFEGHEWAMACVSPKFGKLLGWEQSTMSRSLRAQASQNNDANP